MKEAFVAWRNNLKDSQKGAKSFSDDLFNSTAWFGSMPMVEDAEQSIDRMSMEKVETIDSLVKFVSKKVETKKEKTLNVQGAQLSLKSNSDKGLATNEFVIENVLDKEKLDSYRVHIHGEDGWTLKTLGELEKGFLLLVGDPKKEANVSFDSEAVRDSKWQLLHKMVKAMNLSCAVALGHFFVNDTTEDLNIFASVKYHYDPCLTLSFGASATNLLLGQNTRLTSVHGDKVKRVVKSNEAEFTYEFVPIFHPDFLLINPKMKRTTWVDLQKVMDWVEQN